MIKIGKRTVVTIFPKILVLFFLSIVSVVQAQNVEVKTTLSQNEVFTGERIAISVEISGSGFNNVSRPTIPAIPEGLQLLSRTPSTSRSFSFVNGKSSITYSYTYYMVGDNEGSFDIPPFMVTIDNRSYETNTVSVKIVDRNKAAQQSTANNQGGNAPDIYITMEVSDTTPFVGQQILADVMLYFKSGLEVLSYQPVMGWKAEGFWKEQLENNERPKAYSTIINGVRFRKARLMQFALFPTKTGNLELSEYKINANVRSVSNRNDAFSSFFGGFNSNNRRIELSSDVIKLDVKSLPEIERAQNIGAVGKFNIDRSLNTDNVLTGETIEIITTIEGTGNIPLINPPEYQLPEGFEIYDPEDQLNVNRNGKQIAGTRTFTNVLVARKAGNFTVPESRIAYFDATSERYRVESLSALTINVKKDPNSRRLVDVSQTSLPVQPVLGLATWTRLQQQSLSSYWWFWTGLITPFMLLALGYWRKSYRDRMLSDTYFARSQKAIDKAKKAMDEAYTKAEDGDIKEAYGALHRALAGYIGDRLGLPEAGLSDEEYIQKLREQGTDEKVTQRLHDILNKCSTIRYAPLTTIEDLADDIAASKKLLGKLKRKV